MSGNSSAAVPARSLISNPWIIALVVVIPTFMEVLDTTIAIVALRYIAGGLSAAEIDSEWVITSYLAANATILPISGWLSARFGRRNYFLASILLFTLSSVMCGAATSLGSLILFRVIQGLAGGGLQPSSQAILLDAFPTSQQGSAMTLYGMAALLAPIVGPTLGGYLTVYHDWRWVFYINLPIGLMAYFLAFLVLKDPEYLVKKRAEMKREAKRFDTTGLGFLALTMSAWEILLSKGQEWDWLRDPFGRVQILVCCFVFGLVFLVWNELRSQNPILNFRPFRERNFLISCMIIFTAFSILYGASTTLPSLMQNLFHYDAFTSGLVMSPAGIFAFGTVIVVGFLMGKKLDARILITVGLTTIAVSNFWMAYMTPGISPWQLAWPRVMLVMGMSMVFAPLNVAAYKYMPQILRGSAVGLFALLRNEGGSFGTSMTQTLQTRREQFHTLRVNDYLDPLNSNLHQFLTQTEAVFRQFNADAMGVKLMAIDTLNQLRDQQALALSYFDCFYLFGVLACILVFGVLLMKQSKAEGSVPVGE